MSSAIWLKRKPKTTEHATLSAEGTRGTDGFSDFAQGVPKSQGELSYGVRSIAEQASRSYMEYLTCHEKRASFQLKETSSFMVFSLLSKLSKSKATGLDKISARLLRVCSDLIAQSICSIFNRSINTGIFPEKWKCSKVVPLFKQGKRNDLNNYPPISIIPVVAKIFESIIHDQVNVFFNDNGLLSNSQSGFRRFHFRATALLEATNE